MTIKPTANGYFVRIHYRGQLCEITAPTAAAALLGALAIIRRIGEQA